MMTERNVNDECSIKIREREESVIAATDMSNQTVRGEGSHQTVRGEGSQEDKVNTVSFNIEAKLVSKGPSLTSTCIFRIPDRIKKLHEKDFVPRLVSIGPFHYGRKNLQAMEPVKLWYLHKLLCRKPTPQTNLKRIVEEVTNMEEYCRNCYDENLDLSSEAFVERMVVDGCFIIEFYRKMAYELPQDKDIEFENQNMPAVVVFSDLFLLENQLPWRVVDCLFELTKKVDIHNQVSPETSESLWNLCCKLWEKELHGRRRGKEPVVTVEGWHLLNIYRLLSVEEDYTTELCQSWVSLPSATELVQIGVDFKCRRNDNKIITFNNGVMEISPIGGGLKDFCLLRNLVAMEECESRGPHRYQITSYCRIMNDLIKSTKDVEILIENRILLEGNISKEEMASFFYDICNNTVTTPSPSMSIMLIALKVKGYYKRRWVRRWIALIKRDYLYNPSSMWSVSNAVALVIILTLIQTIYSVLSYHHKS